MVFTAPSRPLELRKLPDPRPGPDDVLLRVHACGVCRTDLHLLDGEVEVPEPPRVLGHQIVGEVLEEAGGLKVGQRVGVPWLGWVDGTCAYCRSGRENLCPNARFTGRDRDGGFAELTVADARFCFPIPEGFADLAAAPLLCAGLIGYRTLRLAGDRERVGAGQGRLGIYGFGAAAHIVCQVARWLGWRFFAFTRAGDEETQEFARRLGAEWAGASEELPPEELDAALIFAPVGPLVPPALRALAPDGVVVCGGIHMSDIPSFPYELLYHEHRLRSVANLTRQDGVELLELAPRVPVHTEVTRYPLEETGQALEDLRAGRFRGAAVVVP
jgi:alcohol dehydrogenase, propanol-preferring